MLEAYLSSKSGQVREISLYRYDLEPHIIRDKHKFSKFSRWLEKSFLIYEYTNTCFFSFEKLKDDMTKDYRINATKTISTPFANTQLVSRLLANILKKQMSIHFKQFLNENIFIIESVNIAPFTLLKCVEFNIEVFSDGNFFIHTQPISKIISESNPIDKYYLFKLKSSNKNNSNLDRMEFHLIHNRSFYRTKLDLLEDNVQAKIDEVLNKEDGYLASFNYEFLASFAPEAFGEIHDRSSKEIKSSILLVKRFLEKIMMPSSFNLSDDVFKKVTLNEPLNKSNLLVGKVSELVTIHSKTPTQFGFRVEFTRDELSKDLPIDNFIKNTDLENDILELRLPKTLRAVVTEKENWKKPYITKIVKKKSHEHALVSNQAASFYHGIYKPVHNCTILPIIFDDLNISLFTELLYIFNKRGKNFNVLEPIQVGKNGEIDINQIKSLIGDNKLKTLITVFCSYQMPKVIFSNLAGFKFQIYQGETIDSRQNRSKLSNFVCKCLEKLGGITSAIASSEDFRDKYFIGLDLGHSTKDKEQFSHLAMTMFDQNGIQVGSFVKKNIAQKENLIQQDCKDVLNELDKKLKFKSLPIPKSIIIHRDGKLHASDIDALKNAVDAIWPNTAFDIVEIIKSGFPLMVVKQDSKNAVNPDSGSCFIDEQHKYAILVTNIQAQEKNNFVNPIIVKHQFGETDFRLLIDQVYWLTKVYTNNLYNSTRLPATTLKANNIVGTSLKRHQASYLG